MQILQETVEHALAAEDGFPRVAAHEIADPQGNDHKLVEKLLARTGVERDEKGERIAEEHRTQSYRRCDAHGAEKDFGVERIRNQLVVVLEVPLVDEETVADHPEAVGEHQAVRE